MPVEIIQHIPCTYRDKEFGEDVLWGNLPQEEQYFRRQPHPFTDEELDDLVDKTHQYTVEQAKWKELEEWRFENGVYAYINGKLKYIPGSYWCYVNYWYLEDGEHPDYREDERLFAVCLEFLCFLSALYGCTRPKGRRQGATSFGAFLEWFIAGRKEFKNCGTVSFNDDAASDVFANMIMPGFKAMLPCFQAEFDSPDDGRSFLRFAKPSEKKKKGSGTRKRQGLNSLIDFKSMTLNSYTNKRLSFLLLDEFGRWAKLNCNLYWSKVSKALRKGKKKRGFAYMPTVVNPKELGGENYKRFYEQSDQRKYGMDTPTGCVIYIMYGTQCYAGCIDKFGESVIEDPTEPIMGNDGEWITEGSKTIILRERALLSGIELMEHRRDYPIDEYDIFAFETGVCEFNEERLIKHSRWLDEHPAFLRRCRLYPELDKKKNIYTEKEEPYKFIKYMDDNVGEWLLLEKPELPKTYRWSDFHYNPNVKLSPTNELRYSIGVDTIKSGFTSNGSTATICVFKKSNIVNGEEKGLYPVAIYMGKPRLMSHLYENVLMACMWYGCKVTFEIDAGTGFYDYFAEKDATAFLNWTPRVAIDVTKKHPLIKPGVESANPFQFNMQLEVAKKYVDGTLVDGYNGNIHRVMFPLLVKQLLEYDHSDRTKSDLCISLMMALLPCFNSVEYKYPPKPVKAILPRYKIKMRV